MISCNAFAVFGLLLVICWLLLEWVCRGLQQAKVSEIGVGLGGAGAHRAAGEGAHGDGASKRRAVWGGV